MTGGRRERRDGGQGRDGAVAGGASGGDLVVAEGVSRTYGRGSVAVVAVHGASCRRPRRRADRPGRPLGIGKVDPPASPRRAATRRRRGRSVGRGWGRRHPGWPPARSAWCSRARACCPTSMSQRMSHYPWCCPVDADAAARAAALGMLADLDLAELASKLPGEISGGQAPARRRGPGIDRRPEAHFRRRADGPAGSRQRQDRHCPAYRPGPPARRRPGRDHPRPAHRGPARR